MNNVERIRELIRDLERGCDKMSGGPARHRSRPSAIGFASGECRAGSGEAGGMNLEIARQMLVVSECITASLQGYLFKFTTGYTPARHRSRPNEAVSHAQGFRSGEAGGDDEPAKPIPPFFSWRDSV
jgi:hypothetical protein